MKPTAAQTFSLQSPYHSAHHKIKPRAAALPPLPKRLLADFLSCVEARRIGQTAPSAEARLKQQGFLVALVRQHDTVSYILRRQVK